MELAPQDTLRLNVLLANAPQAIRRPEAVAVGVGQHADPAIQPLPGIDLDIEMMESVSRKLGFKRCVVPESNLKRLPAMSGIERIGVRTVAEAVELLS